MKIIYVLMITTTTWFNGNPQTTEIGRFTSADNCYMMMERVVKRYKETFPEHIVHLVPGRNQCEMKEVSDREYRRIEKREKNAAFQRIFNGSKNTPS